MRVKLTKVLLLTLKSVKFKTPNTISARKQQLLNRALGAQNQGRIN